MLKATAVSIPTIYSPRNKEAALNFAWFKIFRNVLRIKAIRYINNPINSIFNYASYSSDIYLWN
jgi:hypothetical protein